MAGAPASRKLKALVAGAVRLPRETLLLEGVVGLIITLLAAFVLLRWLSPAVTVILFSFVLVPYLTLVVAGQRLS